MNRERALKNVFVLAVILASLAFARSAHADFEREIYDDNFNEVADATLNSHTADYTVFSGQYYEHGSTPFRLKISGAKDALVINNSIRYTNHFTMGAYTLPVEFRMTFKHTGYSSIMFFMFRRNDGDQSSGTLDSLTIIVGPAVGILLYRFDDGSLTYLASGTGSISQNVTYLLVVQDTGTNVKVMVGTASGEDDLTASTTQRLSHDNSDYNAQTHIGYCLDAVTGNIYHAKAFDSLIQSTATATPTFTFTATPTPTPTATLTMTATSTPDPLRKIFVYDKARRKLRKDTLRRDLKKDTLRRIFRKR